MTDTLSVYELPARRSKSGEDPLIGFLRAAQNAPVTVNAKAVGMLDSLRLRTLLSAQANWAQRDLPFAVTEMSESFRTGLERLGLPATQFDPEEK